MKQSYALIGEKLSHSVSPCIHEAVFEVLGKTARYDLMEIPRRFEGHIVQKLWHEGISGANVTIPYKQTVIRQLDELSEAAKIGAVNTITLRDGKFYGDNTDYTGFGKMLVHSGIEAQGKVAAVLGAGGAAKAVVAYLLDHGVKTLYMVSRQAQKKTGFEQKALQWISYETLATLSGDLLINCTPVGMYPNQGVSPVGKQTVAQFAALVDLIYNPRETEFLRLGRECGKHTCDGLYMLVAQAVYAAEYFLSRKFDDAAGEIGRITAALRRDMLNVALIGMPSSGKSTVGRALAEKLGKKFIDLDEEIVKADGRSIPDIFAAEGEDGFRARESAQTARFAKEGRQLLSCGGGIIKRGENLRALHQNGVVLFIDRPLDALTVGGGRPLSSSPEALRQMEAERRPLYLAAADAVIPNSGTVEDAVAAAMEALDEIFSH